MKNRTMIETSHLRAELTKMLNNVNLTVDEILQRSGVSKHTFYHNIMTEATRRTNITVADRIAKAVGWGMERDGDKVWFIPPESEQNLDARSKKMIEKIKTLKPETREKIEFLIEQLAQKEK